MRILLLTADFPPQKGGIQNLVSHLADGLAAAHELCVIAPAMQRAAQYDAGRRFFVGRAPRLPLRLLSMMSFTAVALLRAFRRTPDVIVCGHVVLGPVCWLLARIFGCPVVVLAYAWEIRAPRMRAVAGWTLRRAAMVISISRFTRDSVIGHGVPPDRVTVIHPAAGTHPTDRAVPPAPVAEQDKVILTVARLGELYKGHDMVIRAMPLILSQEPNARYVIVGDGPLRRYLERLAASLGIARAVTFAGEVSDAALDSWYRRADVFALLSRESGFDGGAEGFGLAFVEAGAWGKPVVGGRSGGIPDAVIDGETGLLVDPTDAGAIATAIVRVLADRGLADSLGSRGRSRALHELTWPNVVTAVQSVLEGVVAAPRFKEDVRSART